MMDRVAITVACAPPADEAAARGAATRRRLTALWEDESAPTSVEYAILASLIAGLIVAAVTTFGVAVRGLFTKVTW